MQYLLYILAIPFLYFNYKIIFSDLKYKKIPNKYLGYLLLIIPFYYIYLFFNFPEINYLLFIGQIIVTFSISFILYYFGVWAAGDAKYLLTLSLFIPYIGIIPFAGNIALITIIYLLGYFLWFYFGKTLIEPKWRKNLLANIKQDLNEKWEIYKENKGGKTFYIIFKFILFFLIIFTILRLLRLYIFNNIANGNNSYIYFFNQLLEKYDIYLIIFLIVLLISIIYIIKKIILNIKLFLNKHFSINTQLIGNILLIILGIGLITFIFYEYSNNKYEIEQYLIKIFTFYISLYIIFKTLIYSYKITFGIAETNSIDLKLLKENDIVDKTYLIKMFGTQTCLGSEGGDQDKNGFLYPSPIKYFEELSNSITKKDIIKLKKIYKITNNYHKNKINGYEDNNTIKILNTFSFAPYLLLGFLITYFFENEIFRYIITFVVDIIKKLAYS